MHSPQFGSLSVSRSVPPCHLLMSSGMYGLRFYSKCTSRPKHLSVGDHIPHQRHKLQDGKTEKWRKVNFLDRNLTTRATALATPRIIGSNRRFFLFLVPFGWSEFDRKLLSFRLVSDLFSPLHDHRSSRSDCHFLQWRIGLDCSYYEVDLFLWMIDLLSLLAGCLAIGEGYWRVNFIICAKVM